jgi:hypothetical protein
MEDMFEEDLVNYFVWELGMDHDEAIRQVGIITKHLTSKDDRDYYLQLLETNNPSQALSIITNKENKVTPQPPRRAPADYEVPYLPRGQGVKQSEPMVSESKSYCVFERKQTGTKDEQIKTTKNGRTQKCGLCTSCGRKKCCFIKKQ